MNILSSGILHLNKILAMLLLYSGQLVYSQNQYTSQDSSLVYWGKIKMSTFVQRDLLEPVKHISGTLEKNHFEYKFDQSNLGSNAIRAKMKGNMHSYSNTALKKKNEIELARNGLSYSVTIVFGSYNEKYKLVFKRGYELTPLLIEYPTKKYPFITLYFKSKVSFPENSEDEYFSVRFPVTKRNNILSILGYR